MSRTVSSVVTAAAIVLAAATPAQADSPVGLSHDGVTYTSSLDEPLFDPDVRWVPGDSRTESFYVRNLAADDADLSIDVLGMGVDTLVTTGDLMVSARSAGRAWQDVNEPGEHRLVSAADLASGRASRIDVKVALTSGATNATQVQRLNLDVRVLLSEDLDTPMPDGGLLPDTGGPTLLTLLAGLTLVTGGIILVRRRREVEPTDV